GRWLGQADVGYSFFVEAGRLRAGDVPYGVTTPVRATIGAGLLAAVPPGSKRTYRLDLAVPVARGPGAKWELRLTTQSVTRGDLREPNDVRRSRERAVPEAVFGRP